MFGKEHLPVVLTMACLDARFQIYWGFHCACVYHHADFVWGTSGCLMVRLCWQVAHMAALEGLDAHKRAVTLRLDALKNGAGGSQ